MGKCESIVKSNDDILIAALLEGESPVDWYVRKDMPVPKEDAWRLMILKTQILVSMLKSTKGYLGKFDHVRVQHELATVYLFPLGVKKTLCIVARPEKDSALVRSLRKQIAAMSK